MTSKFKLLAMLPLLVASASSAVPVTKVVTIQPILLVGDTSATVPYASYEAELDKIWAQAGIDIRFLSPNVNPSSGSDRRVDLSELTSSVPGAESSFFTQPRGQNADPLVLNMWFVGEITAGTSGTVLGVSNYRFDNQGVIDYGGNGILISKAIFEDYSPDLFDVMAHELGHNLGLAHIDLPTGWESPPSCTGESYSQLNNLMTSCLQTQFTRSLENISPDGQGAFHLTDEQVGLVRSSVFARDLALETPEPATLALVLLGLAVSGMARRGSREA